MSLPPPDEAALHEAALAYLARFAATEATLTRALLRRIDRWARRSGSTGAAAQAAAGAAARGVVARLVAAGAVDDHGFIVPPRPLTHAALMARAVPAAEAAGGS